jgi:hypothetical protein
MQPNAKYVLASVILIIVASVGTSALVAASTQDGSGQFNPQTQFAVGTTLQITSISGLETAPPPFTGFSGVGWNNGNHAWGGNGQYGNHTQPPWIGQGNQEWNLTYLQNAPTTNSSITINAEVTNDTQDGGILWTVQGGSIDYNETTLTVTGGVGGIGKLDRVVMVGNATDSNGNTLRWSLEGLATLYSGTVIVSLTGTIAQTNQSSTWTWPARPNQGLTLRGLTLTYVATIS